MGQLHRPITPPLLLLLLLTACAGGKETFTSIADPDEQNDRKAPLSYYEATLRPSDFDEEIEIVQQTHAREYGTNPIIIPADSMVVEEVVAQGFRIQIFASSSIDEANAARITAMEKVGSDSVYVVYDPPVYKVRVGDYAARLDANQRLSRLINMGYTDAWVVADRIIQRRLTRIPKQ